MEAKMSMQTKKEFLNRMRLQYAESDRSKKTEIVNAVVSATGYHQRCALAALRQHGESLFQIAAESQVTR
jgi:lysine/ornithine N-monooxygenase